MERNGTKFPADFSLSHYFADSYELAKGTCNLEFSNSYELAKGTYNLEFFLSYCL